MGLTAGSYFVMKPGKRLHTRRGGGRVVRGGDACVAPTGGGKHAQEQDAGDASVPTIYIKLSWEVRQEAGSSVGARVVDVGMGAAFIAFMVARRGGWDRVSPSWEPRELDAGDHEGPPNRSAPPSPLRNSMGFS